MKKPAATSPFAAMNHQEQRHQWTVWHAQQDATRPAVPEKDGLQQLPDREEKPQPAPQPEEKAPAAPPPAQQQPHHGQYDAVIRRLRNAGRQTQQFVPASSPVPPSAPSVSASASESTTQPPSGSP